MSTVSSSSSIDSLINDVAPVRRVETYAPPKPLEMLCTNLMQMAGEVLLLEQKVISFGMVLLHRFMQSFSRAPRHLALISAAALFTASKVTGDSPRKLGDIATVFFQLENPGHPLLPIGAEYNALKDRLSAAEIELLSCLHFELENPPTYTLLLIVLNLLNADRALAQAAWKICTDCHITSICVDFPPLTVAVSSIYMAAEFLGDQLPTSFEKTWYEVFEVSFSSIEEICLRLLAQYEVKIVPEDMLVFRKGSTP